MGIFDGLPLLAGLRAAHGLSLLLHWTIPLLDALGLTLSGQPGEFLHRTFIARPTTYRPTLITQHTTARHRSWRPQPFERWQELWCQHKGQLRHRIAYIPKRHGLDLIARIAR